MDKASEALFALKPVTLPLQTGHRPRQAEAQFGLVAEDVEKVNPRFGRA